MNAVLATQAIAGTLYLVVITVVGIRLLLLARRTRQLPEALLGGALVLGGTLGASLEAGGIAVLTEGNAAIGARMLMAGKVVGWMGVTCQAIFVRRVFRPAGRASQLTVLAIVALVGLSVLAFWRGGILDGAPIALSLLLFEFAGRNIGSFWMLAESARYTRLMRRRLEIGLADPIVVNRFRLWTIAACCSPIMLATSIPPAVLDPERFRALLTIDLLVFSATGIVVSVCYWLALMPPAFYRRRFEAANSQAA